MSRFNKKIVNETWDIVRTESGRKRATGLDNGRKVSVWVSDLKDESGYYPVMGRYLLPIPHLDVVDGELKDVKTLWVTKGQYKDIMRKSKAGVKKAGMEDFIHALAKLFDKLAVKVREKIGPNATLDSVLNAVFDSVMEKVMDKSYIESKISDLIDRIDM